MNKKPKLLIPIKQDRNKPVNISELRTCPEELINAETPEMIKASTRTANYLPEMLSISEAVEKTNLSYEYLRYLCYSGRVNHIRCGRKYMIDSGALAEFIKRGGADKE